ncbi:hypothetical protein ScPMuIL_008316 [Solemya velum]
MNSFMLGNVRIKVPVESKTSLEGDSVEFICEVTVNPWKDRSKLEVKWKHSGHFINLSNTNKYRIDRGGQILEIKNVGAADAGVYGCVASVGDIRDMAYGSLKVKTVPEAPYDLEMVECIGHSAELRWKDGDNGGDEIISYIVQFNMSDNPHFWHNYHEQIPSSTKLTQVNLSPWGRYSFRLLSRNIVGYSDPSSVTKKQCTTPPDHPGSNPEDVRTLTHKKGKLIITWKPMERLLHNGPGFQYTISWRPRGSTYWNTEQVFDAKEKQLEVDVSDVYGLYEIKVKAGNDMGDSFQPAFVILGRSGEQEPLVSPQDFRMDPTKRIEPHRAHFIWEAVSKSEDKLRGAFKGYKLRYWKSSEGRHKWKEVDIMVDDDRPDVRAAVSGLPAFTPLRAHVVVKNSHYTGPASEIIDFFTPQGVPGKVRDLRVETEDVGATFVLLQWLPPEEINGILVGYDIGYQRVISTRKGQIKSLEPKITNPSTLGARITSLQPNHDYRFYVWARTEAGMGKPEFIDIRTAQTEQGGSHVYRPPTNGQIASIYQHGSSFASHLVSHKFILVVLLLVTNLTQKTVFH